MSVTCWAAFCYTAPCDGQIELALSSLNSTVVCLLGISRKSAGWSMPVLYAKEAEATSQLNSRFFIRLEILNIQIASSHSWNEVQEGELVFILLVGLSESFCCAWQPFKDNWAMSDIRLSTCLESDSDSFFPILTLLVSFHRAWTFMTCRLFSLQLGMSKLKIASLIWAVPRLVHPQLP